MVDTPGAPWQMDCEMGDKDESSITRRALTMDSVLLSSKRRFEQGEAVVVHLLTTTPGQRVCISGSVARCREARKGKGYLVKVTLTAVQGVLEGITEEHQDRTGSSGAGLMSGSSPDLSGHLGSHMRGSLSEVNLPGLLNFLDQDRRSARLTITWPGGGSVVLFVRQGRLLDVAGLEGNGAGDRRTRLYHLLDREDGDFELAFTEVDREDRYNISTSSLLLDYAVAKDEAERV